METKVRKRYSEGFKLKVMEELRDGKWKTVSAAGEAYGIRPKSIRTWMKQLGFDYLNGRVIYVKTRTELDEINLNSSVQNALTVENASIPSDFHVLGTPNVRGRLHLKSDGRVVRENEISPLFSTFLAGKPDFN